MGGTHAGGMKAADKNLAKDKDYYKKIGHKGGKISKGGPFATDHKFASEMGKLGGAAIPKNKR